jgi:hypothetical protein
VAQRLLFSFSSKGSLLGETRMKKTNNDERKTSVRVILKEIAMNSERFSHQPTPPTRTILQHYPLLVTATGSHQ